jgi:phytoene dehydrogenase-like protein
MTENTYHTIVVGGGIAGLTAAAFMAKAGKKVILIEKNHELGGLVNSFWRNGFKFEAGVRALEDAGIIFPLLKDLDIDFEVVKSKVSLGIEDRIIHIEDINSLEEYRNLLKEFYPESEKDIDELLKTIKKVMKHMEVLYGIENPVFKDLKRDFKYIFTKLLPWLPRFIFTVGKINRMQLPVEEYLDSTIKDQHLRDIISQHFFKNTPSFFALSYFSLYLDYFYPKGGVGTLSESIQEKILELGGEIKNETIIKEVLAEKNIVIDDQGNSYKYENLIWAADLKTLYNITDLGSLDPKVKTRIQEVKSKMMANRGSESVLSLYLQIDEPLETFGKIANGHFFYTPSRQGLGQTHRADLDALIANFENTSKEEVLQWMDRFTSLNTYEISIPGLKDSSLVPPGKTGMIISLLTDHELFRKVKEAGWLKEFVTEFENRMLATLSKSIFPMFEEKIIGRFSFNPLSIQNRIASSEGAIVGWAFKKDLPVRNNIQHSALSVLTPIPSVFQAGQWAFSPAGVPMSILTGKLAADKVLKTK